MSRNGRNFAELYSPVLVELGCIAREQFPDTIDCKRSGEFEQEWTRPDCAKLLGLLPGWVVRTMALRAGVTSRGACSPRGDQLARGVTERHRRITCQSSHVYTLSTAGCVWPVAEPRRGSCCSVVIVCPGERAKPRWHA